MARFQKPAGFQSLSPDIADTESIAVAVASATVTIPSGTVAGDVIQVASSTNCYMTFTATATSSDMFLPAATVFYFVVPSGVTSIAAIRDTADGTMSITRMI